MPAIVYVENLYPRLVVEWAKLSEAAVNHQINLMDNTPRTRQCYLLITPNSNDSFGNYGVENLEKKIALFNLDQTGREILKVTADGTLCPRVEQTRDRRFHVMLYNGELLPDLAGKPAIFPYELQSSAAQIWNMDMPYKRHPQAEPVESPVGIDKYGLKLTKTFSFGVGKSDQSTLLEPVEVNVLEPTTSDDPKQVASELEQEGTYTGYVFIPHGQRILMFKEVATSKCDMVLRMLQNP